MHPATLHSVGVITKLYFATIVAFKAEPEEEPPVPHGRGRGAHVCSGASCYVSKKNSSFFNVFEISVKIFISCIMKSMRVHSAYGAVL